MFNKNIHDCYDDRSIEDEVRAAKESFEKFAKTVVEWYEEDSKRLVERLEEMKDA